MLSNLLYFFDETIRKYAIYTKITLELNSVILYYISGSC
jgi:hypothetical protein